MKTLAQVLTVGLTTVVVSASPSLLAAQSTGDPSVSTASGPLVGEELQVTYFPDLYGPVALRATRTVRLEVVSYAPDRLVGRYRGQLLIINGRAIRSLKRRVGTKPASAPAMALGSAGGFAAAFLIGMIAHQDDPTGVGSRTATDDGLVAGVLLGAPLGALVAWVASRSRPIYEDVGIRGLRPWLAVNPTGQVDLSFSIPTG